MADNFIAGPGQAAVTVASKDASGVQHPKSVTEFLVSGAPTPVDLSNPLPVVVNGAVTSVADGAAFTTGTDQVLPLGGVTSNAAVAANKAAALSLELDRRLRVSSVREGKYVKYDGVQYAVSRLLANPTADGVLLAAQGSGKQILILGLTASASAEFDWRLLSAAAALTQTFYPPARGGIVLPFNETGYYLGGANEALNYDLVTGTGTLGLSIQYIVIG